MNIRMAAVGVSAAALALVVAISCTSTPPPVGLAEGCSINSDCQGALVCVFGRCHVACVTSKDCSGGPCVPPGVCELKSEQTCSQTLPCVAGLTCVGAQCLAPCSLDAGLLGQSVCLPDQTCEQMGNQQVCVETASDAGTGEAGRDGGHKGDAGAHDGGRDGTVLGDGGHADARPRDGATLDSADVVVNPCTNNPQTLFGGTATGDSNASFTTGVGVRTASELLVFSGYSGRDPQGFDAGLPDGSPDGGVVGLVYLQTFDASTLQKRGPAAPYLRIPGATSVLAEAVAIAPSGQIVVLVASASQNALVYGSEDDVTPLYAAFLSPAPDGGGAPAVEQLVQIETANVVGPAYAIWSASSNAFILSWQYDPGGYVKVRRFLADGNPAGGDTDVVPTQYGADQVANSSFLQGSIGASGNILGVAYRGNAWSPEITLLDQTGAQVPSPLSERNYSFGSNDNAWLAIGGTGRGLVYVFETSNHGPITTFVPTAPDAGYLGDAGDGGGLSSFTLPGGIAANMGLAVSDAPGAGGGVGLAFLYPDSVSFAYVGGSGRLVAGPTDLFAHTYAAGDEISVSNFRGSFGVTLYSMATHSTSMVTSGCTP